jgi:hypothetical protein
MDQNEHPLEPCHLGVPSGASKTIFMSMVQLAQTMHLSCTDTNTISNGPKWDSTWPMSPRCSIRSAQNDFSAYGTFNAKRAPILHQYQHCLQMVQNEIPHETCHLVVLSGVSKMIFEPMVCLAKTVHLSCIKISTISKRTETTIHLSLVT